MNSAEIISLVVTIVGVGSFSAIFTILYSNYANMSITELKSGKRDIELIDEVIYDRQDKIKKRNKIFSIIRSVCFYLILIIVVPIFVVALFNKVTGNVMMIGDKTLMVVASGSMSEKHENNTYLDTYGLDNQFQTGDIILLEKVNSAAELKKFDVIAFTNNSDTNIIHRIKEIRFDGTYETRGDANKDSDTYNPKFNDVIGKYTGKKINGVGIFILFFQSYSGIITIISLVYCLVMIDRITNKISKVQLKRIELLEEAIGLQNEVEIGKFKAAYIETIYYKGYAYHFKEGSFIDKEELSNSPYLEKSNDTLIKELVDNENLSIIKEEIIIDDEQGDE